MSAGLILLGNIWQFSETIDDVGGSVPTGTVVYQGIQARIQNSPNSLEMNIQGYETSKFFSAIIQPRPGMNLVEKKHYFQVSSPPNHRYYQKFFRITSIQEPNVHPADPRRYLLVNFERSDPQHIEGSQ